jgi:hypothetical protein
MDCFASLAMTMWLILPDGQINSPSHCGVSSPVAKNNSLSPSGKSSLQIRPSRPTTEERFAIVTDVGRDAVDADALLTNGAEADGKIVWS